MLEAHLFPPDLGLAVTVLTTHPAALQIALATTAPTAACPLCHQPATRVHSRYHRTLADLPCLDYAVQLDLQVRRFRCCTGPCPRRIFTERLPGFVRPWAHRTTRAATALQQTGLALGGEAGARLLLGLHLPVSPDTLLRLVRQLATTPPRPTPRILGVDDWALRKGRTYGTILVDLEIGHPVDLLPDREADTLAAWLQAHPGVEVISRDRAGAYADGARRGAPQAAQVADRFHILKNLGDALEELLARIGPTLAVAPESTAGAPAQADALPAAPALPPGATKAAATDGPSSAGSAPATPATRAVANPPAEELATVPLARDPRRRPRDQERSQTRRAQRLARYEEVQQLHQAGWTDSAIARKLDLDRGTVQKWVQSPEFPERRPRPRPVRQIDAYRAYLADRWAAGCHNARRLWQEIRAQGYRGGYTQVAAYLAADRPVAGPLAQRGGGDPAARQTALPSARALRWLLWRPVAEWSDDDYRWVRRLGQQSKELTVAYGLVVDFQTLMRERRPEEWANWVQVALASGLPEVGRFARGVLRDFAAVYAGMEGIYSNGPVEGHVNRLKMLKRQLFGRANFDLLRLRVLYAT